jgi:transcriptional regulator with XRE-family HTH domain
MRAVNVSSIGSYIREQREQAKISIRQLAQAAGVSNPYLSQVERGLRRPSADILQQIAKGLRISAEALYVQAGMLDEKKAETSVTDAIMADPEITERQKQMLIDIYESFRKEVRSDAEARTAAGAESRPGSDVSAAAAAADEAAEAGAWAEASAWAEDAEDSADAEAGPLGPDPVAEAIEESGHDPLAATTAAAEADPWTDPSAPGNR